MMAKNVCPIEIPTLILVRQSLFIGILIQNPYSALLYRIPIAKYIGTLSVVLRNTHKVTVVGIQVCAVYTQGDSCPWTHP